MRPEQTAPGAAPRHRVRLASAVPQYDGFARDQPAILEGPEERWAAVRTLIDYGGALFTAGIGLPGRSIRALVLVALLRRALITAESIWQLLARGLVESAVGLHRTLLDVELNTKLVAGDTTERMAKRLAAYHYLSHQRHGQRALGDRATREEVLALGTTGLAGAVETARAFAEFVRAPAFDDVRDAVAGARYWHGYASQEDAFRAVGASSDYFTTYDTASIYLHAANVERDIADVQDDGSPVVRAFVERDPERLRSLLGDCAFRLRSVLGLFVAEHPLPAPFGRHPDAPAADERPETRRDADGTPLVYADPLSGLTAQLLSLF